MTSVEPKTFYNLKKLNDALISRARMFSTYLFPNGKCVGGEYVVGSLGGESGESLKICLEGEKTGLWKDFATGEGGKSLLHLLYRLRDGDFYGACKEAADWLGCRENIYDCDAARPANTTEMAEKDELKYHPFCDLQKGTPSDFFQLAHTMDVNVYGIELADEDGILEFFNHSTNGRCWSIVHRENFVRQDRRLDGLPFILSDKSVAKARTLGFPGCPVGIPTNKPIIMLVEGSSDILAAYSLIYAENMETMVTPVAMLGASNNIHRSSLRHFHGKHVIGFPDYDLAGINGMSRWGKQLDGIAASFKVFSYAGLVRDDGQPIKDLRDFLRVDVDQWENEQDVQSPLLSFIYPLLTNKTKRKI
ncbi:MAG: hypothetical protein LBI47_01715 [Puniceicoccales bacterium]|jgi:hypothetical protein|nr:hypothetical protein [Puniceicoccales bacterium]